MEGDIMDNILEKYPELKERMLKRTEVISFANVAFDTVAALAELLHDKGLIEYEEFVERVYKELGE
ncbi:MAG TPA: hypothetical protein DDY89_19485 [Lysinibacillus sp.]|nr:hypothetical protein [Lysinibacillus sp.]